MTPLTQALLRALRSVAQGSALRDLAMARQIFVELRDAALRPGWQTTAVERVCLRALARFHARFSEQARLEVCTPVMFGALLRAALGDADRAQLSPLESMRHAMSVIAAAQGTGPLEPRATLSSSDGQTTIGDFKMGPRRHDGRWRLARDWRGTRLVDIDIGRRLARRIGTHALEIALCATSAPRDITIDVAPEGYVITGRPRRGEHCVAAPRQDGNERPVAALRNVGDEHSAAAPRNDGNERPVAALRNDGNERPVAALRNDDNERPVAALRNDDGVGAAAPVRGGADVGFASLRVTASGIVDLPSFVQAALSPARPTSPPSSAIEDAVIVPGSAEDAA